MRSAIRCANSSTRGSSARLRSRTTGSTAGVVMDRSIGRCHCARALRASRGLVLGPIVIKAPAAGRLSGQLHLAPHLGPAMNLADSLARTATAHPDRVAIRNGEDTLTYRDLDDASARVAGLLAARNVGPGDPVGIMVPNVPEFAVVYFGVLRAGGVVVPMNPLLKAREVAYYLGDSGASVIFAWSAA